MSGVPEWGGKMKAKPDGNGQKKPLVVTYAFVIGGFDILHRNEGIYGGRSRAAG